MRPARKGPENWNSLAARSTGRHCFNEAGPQGAGKLATLPTDPGDSPSFNEAGPQGAGKRAPAGLPSAADSKLQ